MTTRNLRLILSLIAFLAGASADSQFINSQAASDCGKILLGGSYYGFLDPDYDGSTLYLSDIKGDRMSRQAVYSGSFGIAGLSTSCGQIAFLQKGKEPGTSDLKVITIGGKETHFLSEVLWFDWGKNKAGDDLVAYIRGVRSNVEGWELPSSGEVWVLNTNTGERWKTHTSGYFVTWAEFDSSFYIEEWLSEPEEVQVSRYEVESKIVEQTPYLSSRFSNDGTYYYWSEYTLDSLKLYRRTDHTEITHQHEALLSRLGQDYRDPVGWISDSMLVLGSRTADAKQEQATQHIIDLKEGKLWVVDAEVVGFTGPDGQDLIRLTKDGVVVRAFKDVAQLVYPPQGDDAVEGTKVP